MQIKNITKLEDSDKKQYLVEELIEQPITLLTLTLEEADRVYEAIEKLGGETRTVICTTINNGTLIVSLA